MNCLPNQRSERANQKTRAMRLPTGLATRIIMSKA